MSHASVNFIFARDMLGVVFLLGVRPTRIKLMDLDGNLSHFLEIIGAPHLGKATLAQLTDWYIPIVELRPVLEPGRIFAGNSLEGTDMSLLLANKSLFFLCQFLLLFLEIRKVEPNGFQRLHNIEGVLHHNPANRIHFGVIICLILSVGGSSLSSDFVGHGQCRLLSFLQLLSLSPQIFSPILERPRRLPVLPTLHRMHPCPSIHNPTEPGTIASQFLTKLNGLTGRIGSDQSFYRLSHCRGLLFHLRMQIVDLLLPPVQRGPQRRMDHGLVVRYGAELLISVGQGSLQINTSLLVVT
mmetsp:Transcript_4274/g.12061  ORF Transcript_4274/g.12061 Transcript_4274/m.12061 type:complete len:298 (+) Transcript_4274:1700-2593(+)